MKILPEERDLNNFPQLFNHWKNRQEEVSEGYFNVTYQPTRAEKNGHMFLFSTDLLYNHHYGIDEVYATAIEKLGKSPEYFMNPSDAASLGIEEGEPVTLSASGVETTVKPIFREEVKEGHVVLRGHYHDAGFQRICPFKLDEISKAPLTGVVRVKLQKP